MGGLRVVYGSATRLGIQFFPCFEPVMNPLQRALIEKAGHDNGFENVLPGNGPHVRWAQPGILRR